MMALPVSHDSVAVKHINYAIGRGRCAVLGSATVGKTALIKVLSSPSDYPKIYVPTLNVDISNKVINLPNFSPPTQIDILCFDYPGSAYLNLASSDQALAKSDAFLFVFDVTDRDSFSAIAKWHRRAVDALATRDDRDQLIGCVVGTKIDLRSGRGGISEQQGQDLAQQLGLPYFETSAEGAIGIEAPFVHIARALAKASQE